MKLEFIKLSLQNYRYYYGDDIELEFSTESGKNVVVVKGDNGAGKSNLLNALTWCLYNKEMHNEDSGLPVMNTEYISELAETGKEGETSVSLTLAVEGELWEIKRTIRGYGAKASDWTADEPKFKFTPSFRVLRVSYPENGSYKNATDDIAQHKIDTLLPEVLHSFFFIDGEQLREFFRTNSDLKMQDAIEKLSQLELVNKSLKSLRSYQKDLRSELEKTNPEMKKIQEAMREKEEELEDVKELITSLQRGIKESELKKATIDQFLETYNEAAVKQAATDIKRLENTISTTEKKLKTVIDNKNKYLVESAPRILLSKTINESLKIIGDLISKGELPPRIKSSFIDELLEKGVCVCGHKIGEEEKRQLNEYKTMVQISEYTTVAFEGKSEFETQISKIIAFPDKIDEYNADISDYEYDIQTAETELQIKKDAITGFNIAEINEKAAQRDQILEDIGKKKIQLNAGNIKKQKIENELKTLAKCEKTEEEKSKTHTVASQKKNLVEITINVLDRVIDRVKEKIRTSLERETKTHFLDFLREEGLFRDVRIDDCYKVSVINNQGWNNLNDLSAGQYLILGYAFVVALRAITGYQAPVIVDTPLGKLDKTHQDKITKRLPALLKESQLLFLVTSSEYTPTVKKNLDKFMTKEAYYEISKYTDITSARLEHVK